MSRKGENIYKRKDGRWEGRYKKGVASNSRTIYGSCYGKTYREVKEKLEDCKRKMPQSLGCKKLFGTYCDEWLVVNQNNVKESTFVKYSTAIKNHIKPFFGGYQPEMITTELTAEFVNHLIEVKILSTKTVKDPDNVRVGVILVRTDVLDTDNVKENWEYKADYEKGDNITKHNSEAERYITKIMNGTAFTAEESAICKKSGASVNVTALDNKNMMDYAYSYANINQSTLKQTEHKNYLYRAYSYLIYETKENGVATPHFVKSAPEYFTFYNIASISGEEIVRNS